MVLGPEVVPLHEQARQALAHYGDLAGARLSPLAGGLINQTFAVDAAHGAFVLQQLNPIFDPRLHHNIEAVTRRLKACGVATPELLRNDQGLLWSELPGGVWRVMTRVEGATHHTLRDGAMARSAGALVGRFHRALEGLEHRFEGVRLGVHDTAAHLQTLRTALAEHGAHALYAQAAPLGETILAAAERLQALPALDEPIGHGDLKVSNLMFSADDGGAPQALCLIDLDTLAPMPLAHELGDAWRSWCNRSREDGDGAAFDMALFEASWRGYRQGRGRVFDADERAALLLGPEIISIELAARFCADVLNERYFGWDRARYARAGAHHLVRARGQLALHRAVLATRLQREQVLQARPSAGEA